MLCAATARQDSWVHAQVGCMARHLLLPCSSHYPLPLVLLAKPIGNYNQTVAV